MASAPEPAGPGSAAGARSSSSSSPGGTKWGPCGASNRRSARRAAPPAPPLPPSPELRRHGTDLRRHELQRLAPVAVRTRRGEDGSDPALLLVADTLERPGIGAGSHEPA